MLSLAQIPPTESAGPEGRRDSRTSMLVAATLRAGSQALAVRIRNMSVTGALIEGPVLPLPDTRVELVRAELHATGRIAWVDNGRCGVALDARVSVGTWLSGKFPAHQAQVDALVEEARRDLDTSPDKVVPLPDPASGLGRNDPATDEIDKIIATLATLEDALTADPAVVAAHMVELQALDEAQQRLVALKRRLA